MVRVQFAPTPLGQEPALLHADGYMGAVSVGFRPLEWQIRRGIRTGLPVGMHFHRQELLEVSVVSLPANPEALRKALSDSRLQTDPHSFDSAQGRSDLPPEEEGTETPEALRQQPDGLVWSGARRRVSARIPTGQTQPWRRCEPCARP